MIQQSKGKIYVAEERGCTQQAWRSSYNTFNFGNYQHAHKSAFEKLYVLNDEILAPKHAIHTTVKEDSEIVLIPLIGAVKYKDSYGNKSCVAAGQLQVFSVKSNTYISLANPYDNEAINFLQLWVKSSNKQQTLSRYFPVDLDDNINQLPVVVNTQNITIAIGKFTVQHDGNYQLLQKGNPVFAFVIDGQMEVQYRRLQPRDGLGLWELENITFEALSSSAILLVAEVPAALH